MHSEYTHVQHMFPPVYDEHSRILILGSFPSVKSREQQFYYGHKQNRFWKILAAIYGDADTVLGTIEEKRAFLLAHRVALWDVIDSCDIKGSSDSSIKNIKVNDIQRILKNAPIEKILLNGGKAYTLFETYCLTENMLPYDKLPSSSPANAAWSLEKLIRAWRNKLDTGA